MKRLLREARSVDYIIAALALVTALTTWAMLL